MFLWPANSVCDKCLDVLKTYENRSGKSHFKEKTGRVKATLEIDFEYVCFSCVYLKLGHFVKPDYWFRIYVSNGPMWVVGKIKIMVDIFSFFCYLLVVNKKMDRITVIRKTIFPKSWSLDKRKGKNGVFSLRRHLSTGKIFCFSLHQLELLEELGRFFFFLKNPKMIWLLRKRQYYIFSQYWSV